MKPIKLDNDIARPFGQEIDSLREKGEHQEAFELLDGLSEQAANAAANKLTDNSNDNNSDSKD